MKKNGLKIGLVLIILVLMNSTVLANELLGKWSKTSDKGSLVILFESDSMTQSSSLDMKKGAQTINVRYVKLDNSYGVELLDENGNKVAAMMAVFKDDDTISFGAPGSAFFELKRVNGQS